MAHRISNGDVLRDIETVAEDPDRSSAEKEFTVSMARPDDRATVFSSISSIVRTLLGRDDFEFDWALVSDDGSECYAVSGSLPIGAFRITSTGRSHSRPSAIVAKHDDNGLVDLDN